MVHAVVRTQPTIQHAYSYSYSYDMIIIICHTTPLFLAQPRSFSNARTYLSQYIYMIMKLRLVHAVVRTQPTIQQVIMMIVRITFIMSVVVTTLNLCLAQPTLVLNALTALSLYIYT